MAEAKKLAFTVYAPDPDGGDAVVLRAGTKRRDLPERFLADGVLGAHVWEDDDDEVAPDAPAPPRGVTGQDPAAVDPDAPIDGAALIDGTEDEVLERVDGDPARAQAALDAENGKDKPRKGVVERLQAIVGTS